MDFFERDTINEVFVVFYFISNSITAFNLRMNIKDRFHRFRVNYKYSILDWRS